LRSVVIFGLAKLHVEELLGPTTSRKKGAEMRVGYDRTLPVKELPAALEAPESAASTASRIAAPLALLGRYWLVTILIAVVARMCSLGGSLESIDVYRDREVV
jgi:hypothetical protein